MAVFSVSVSVSSFAQKNNHIAGRFTTLKNTKVRLAGHSTSGSILISEGAVDSSGHFSLKYPRDYTGMAEVGTAEGTFGILLHSEDFEISGTEVRDPASFQFKNSPENEALYQGIRIRQEVDKKLEGLQHLKALYKNKRLGMVNREIYVQEKKLGEFSKKLPKESYSAYYLNLYNLVGNLKAQTVSDAGRLGDLERLFNSLDFADPRLATSGLFAEILDSYFKLLEGNYDAADRQQHFTASIGFVLKSLEAVPDLQKSTAAYLFHFAANPVAAGQTDSMVMRLLPNSDYPAKKESTSFAKP